MRIENSTRSTCLADKCEIADSFIKRFKGLMGRNVLKQGHGLLILPCNSIHMCFMKFPLDIVFIDRDNTVVHIIEGIKPWRLSKIVYNAASVIELPVGTIKESLTQVGDKLELNKL